MPIVQYCVLPSPHLSNDQYKEYKDFIHSTLTDPRGWVKRPYNYNFVQIPHENAVPHRDIRTYFITNEEMVKKFGKGLDRLSCYDPNNHTVTFNLENWNKGTWDGPFPDKDGEDGLTRYRRYVINHEYFHGCGGMHPEPPPSLQYASVMQQHTKGLKWLNRCYPDGVIRRDFNEWPLPANIFNEEYGCPQNKLRYKNRPKLGGGGQVCSINLLWLIILCLCIIVLIIKLSTIIFRNSSIVNRFLKRKTISP